MTESSSFSSAQVNSRINLSFIISDSYLSQELSLASDVKEDTV
jgi:hypothetical protein